MTNLIGTYEILGALCPLVSESERDEAIAKCDAKVNIVANTGSEIHLTLPYYDRIDEIAAHAVSDEETAKVAGGEIVVAIVVGIVALGGLTAAAGGIIDHAVKKDQGKK